MRKARWVGGIVAAQRTVLFHNAEMRADATALIDAGRVLGSPEAEGFPDWGGRMSWSAS
jgi:hypothetical protein